MVLESASFNQEQTLIPLAKMIIIDELAFMFVENEGFKKFMGYVQPKFKIPSRVTIVRYCMHVFNDENEKLKHVLSANKKNDFTYYEYLNVNSKYELHVCDSSLH